MDSSEQLSDGTMGVQAQLWGPDGPPKKLPNILLSLGAHGVLLRPTESPPVGKQCPS